MSTWISTWFYSESADERGEYAQVRGSATSEQFRDVYRRCIAIFFASARRSNPDANLILFVNQDWDASASNIAFESGQILRSLRVKQVVLPYTYRPPDTFSRKWHNQFYVLDVMKWFGSNLDTNDTWSIMDSDIVWASRSHVDQMWSSVQSNGFLSYVPRYERDTQVNGLSQNDLTEIAHRLDLVPNDRDIVYSGGEFIAANGNVLKRLLESADRAWNSMISLHKSEPSLRFEEAHVLSIAYDLAGVRPSGANPFIKRIWTQPFKHRNVESSDANLALWHVPAEKKYGLRRLYQRYCENDFNEILLMSDSVWSEAAMKALGIPGNSVSKIAQDCASAAWGRCLAALPRSTRS